MLKLAPIALFVIATSHVGCDEARPPAQSPEMAWGTYHGRLSEICADKHLENLPADKLRDISVDYYKDSEVQMRQLIDLDTSKACSANPNDPNCYNPGVIQAAIQGGEAEAFAKQVCEKGSRS